MMSKLVYSIKKGIWSRWLSFWYKNEIRDSVTTHLDLLRTSPQNAVNYMLDNKNDFAPVGFVTHDKDY